MTAAKKARHPMTAVGMLLVSAVALATGSCGKEVSLGAGSAANDCIAAGGTCVLPPASCALPTDPALNQACGDPAVARCCMPLPDGSPGSGGVGGVHPG